MLWHLPFELIDAPALVMRSWSLASQNLDNNMTHPSPDGCHNNTSFAATASLFFSVQESRPTRSARRERVAGKAASPPRAARGAAWRRRHVGQHVDVRGAREKRRRRADSVTTKTCWTAAGMEKEEQ